MNVRDANRLNIFLVKMRSRMRVFFGFCPMCNSDAPAVYDCPLCDSHYGPPSDEQKAKWLDDHNAVLNSMASTKKQVAKARRDI